ncbi:hypothetical protein PRJ_5511 (plasmid) [Pseudomonas sp. XWY-1]|nr:hypothetical protein PRJ_5511 [Pseudomonas sp. XWY-1]
MLFTSLVFAVISAGFFIRGIALWCRRPRPGTAASLNRDDDVLFGDDSNIYSVE